jgi:hypothetical protein
MRFSVLKLGLMIAMAAKPVASDHWQTLVWADSSGNALHAGDIIGDAMCIATASRTSK